MEDVSECETDGCRDGVLASRSEEQVGRTRTVRLRNIFLLLINGSRPSYWLSRSPKKGRCN